MFNDVLITQRMKSLLVPRIEQAFEIFKSENNLTKVSIYPKNIPEKLLDSSLPDAVKEFKSLNKELQNATADEIDDHIVDYVSNECDIGFLLSKIQFLFNEEATLQGVKDKMMEMLQHTPPYDQVNRDYWIRTINKIKHVDVLAKYADSDHLDSFVEERASDWKENLKEE